ncbi:MAG: hypothetical protein DRP56_10170 [Planctomycetota bacterium]|nr:MAG: hypothetical protein DRP56_10170 [Planctomycetota bacterium]
MVWRRREWCAFVAAKHPQASLEGATRRNPAARATRLLLVSFFDKERKMGQTGQGNLPQVVVEYIDSVIKAMKYRKKVRAEVREELIDHFTDALVDCETDDEKQKAAGELIAEFGNAKLLGKLLRRAKKRCRPLWKKVIIFSFKLIGILFLLLLLRVGYMATGRPVISVDYIQWMNDKVCDGRDESLNAYYDYQRAIELFSEMPPEVKKIFNYTREQQKTPEDWKAIESFLEAEVKAINAFRTGAAKPCYWNIYQSPEDLRRESWQRKIEEERSKNLFSDFSQSEMVTGVVEGLMPQMSGYKRIAQRVMYFQVPFDIHQGNTEQATDDCIALYRFGQHISSQGVVIEQLVGTSVEAIAMRVIRDYLLNQAELSADDLLRLQKMIEKVYDPDIAPMDWSLEKAFWYDVIQRSFTNNGRGSGRPLLRGVPFSVGGGTDILKGLVTGFPNRKEVISMIDEAFERSAELRSFTPLMMQEEDTERPLRVNKLMYMQQLNGPAMSKVTAISWRVRTGQAGLIGTLSIHRFQKENERLPDDWDELIERGYLETIPLDPYSDKPLIYRKTDDGFILYSIGSNFVDDGGVPGTDSRGKPRDWGENGDWIFWPVEALD